MISASRMEMYGSLVTVNCVPVTEVRLFAINPLALCAPREWYPRLNPTVTAVHIVNLSYAPTTAYYVFLVTLSHCAQCVMKAIFISQGYVSKNVEKELFDRILSASAATLPVTCAQRHPAFIVPRFKLETLSSPLQDTNHSATASPSGPASPPPSSDLQVLMRWVMYGEEAARAEREVQRREDADRLETLLSRLAGPQPLTPVTGATAGPGAPGSASLGPALAPSAPKAAVQPPPPPLSADVTYQTFREWRRRWKDYAMMVDLASLPQPKQLIQLRMCLSLETRRMLEHTLQVPPDSTASVEEVLDTLQEHIKGLSSEALRRRAFSSCKQAAGETFADFFVRLKNLSEEIDVCKAKNSEYEEA
ncbi:hypothetical protein GWK47_010077 [Chionoecetes opilio]|uniref:Uncharacterized protein n=1 Tax=Chionoecetes opilio TaxID=41210 RepID=A0A8J4Y4T3_CHIOP|nr:hypothetical protein GWK47_010077 [Chionoecetes opilio]